MKVFTKPLRQAARQLTSRTLVREDRTARVHADALQLVVQAQAEIMQFVRRDTAVALRELAEPGALRTRPIDPKRSRR